MNDPNICYFVLLKKLLVITCYIFIFKKCKNFFSPIFVLNGSCIPAVIQKNKHLQNMQVSIVNDVLYCKDIRI